MVPSGSVAICALAVNSLFDNTCRRFICRPGCLSVCSSVRLGSRPSLAGRRATYPRSGFRPVDQSRVLTAHLNHIPAQRVFDQSRRCCQLTCVLYGDRYTAACKQRISTARPLVENMMSIKSFVEIKESAAAPCYPSVLSLSAPSQ